MFRIAHFSDPHLAPLPAPTALQLISKRVTGYVNWRRNRHRAMHGHVLEDLLADIHAANPDHICLTGDLVNLALPEELVRAADFLKITGEPSRVSLVPGNHDAYVPGALKRALHLWGPYCTGDDRDAPAFPYLRRRGDIVLIGLSTAVATAPFRATGRLGARQRAQLQALLEENRDATRIIMLHHPVVKGQVPAYKRLKDAGELAMMLKSTGAELILHGHSHLDTTAEIAGPDGPIPVLGVPSASQSIGSHHPPAGWTEISIGSSAGSCQIKIRRRNWNGTGFEDGEVREWSLASPDKRPAQLRSGRAD